MIAILPIRSMLDSVRRIVASRAHRGFVALAVVGSALQPTVIASAHEKKGIITVVGAPSPSHDGVSVKVKITFSGDGHLAPEATVTVVAEHATQPKVGPLTLSQIPGETGIYTTDLPLGGTGKWTVRFSALSPTSYLETSYVATGNLGVADSSLPRSPSSLAGAVTTTEAQALPADSVAPSEVEPAPSTSSTDPIATEEPAKVKTKQSRLPLFGGVLAVVAMSGVAVGFRSRRTKRRPRRPR